MAKKKKKPVNLKNLIDAFNGKGNHPHPLTPIKDAKDDRFKMINPDELFKPVKKSKKKRLV